MMKLRSGMTCYDTVYWVNDSETKPSTFQTSLTGYFLNTGITPAIQLQRTKVPITFSLTSETFDQFGAELNLLHGEYGHFFRTKTGNLSEHSLQYLRGLFTTQGKRTISNIALSVPGASYERLQYFISDSKWSDRPLVDQIQKDVITLMGNRQNGSLHVDESGIGKKGPHSVGAQRQHCGNLGKIDMCQVGVFLSYNIGSDRALIDRELYVPKKQVSEVEYRKKHKIPDDVTFKTKIELALEMIFKAIERGVPFGWIGADCFYGRDSKFRNALAKKNLLYMVDITDDTRIWHFKPDVGIPERKGNHGSRPRKMKVLDKDDAPYKVSDVKKHSFEFFAEEFLVRDSERKMIKARFTFDRVYPVEKGLPGARQWLITREDIDTGEVKYQLSNAPVNITLEELVKMSCSRYWIERAIEDAKDTAGLDEYEVRSYRAWYHHTAMSMLAILFLIRMQHKHRANTPMLTIQDIKDAFEFILPQRQMTTKDVAKYIFNKHRKRMQARISHHKRYRLKRLRQT